MELIRICLDLISENTQNEDIAPNVGKYVVRSALKHLLKSNKDTLILVSLVAVGSVAAVLEHGLTYGFKIIGGVIYTGCVMTLGFAAWRFWAQRRLRLTFVEWCMAVYAFTYALASLALGWPFGFLTVLGLIVPMVVIPVISVFSRFGWW